MLIICPSCATSYDVELASLSPQGRKVRCSRCLTVWHEAPSRADRLVAAAAEIAPEPGVAAVTGDAAALVPFSDEIISPATAEADPPGQSGPDAAAAEQDSATLEAADATAAADAAAVNAPEESAEVEAPPIAPGAPVDPDARPPIEVAAAKPAEPAGEPLEDIETYAARRQRRRAQRRSMHWPLSWLQTGILALALTNVVLVGWRSDIVRMLPQTASFYALLGLPVNLRGLAFENVATAVEQHEGVPIMMIDGTIVNDTRKVKDVPRLKLVVRNAARQEIYSWTAEPARNVLQPGETTSFRARLASPPPEAHDLILRFLTRRDVVAGMR